MRRTTPSGETAQTGTPTTPAVLPTRRYLLRTAGCLLLWGSVRFAHGMGIVAVRVWPALDYTRVTIESDAALQFKQVFVPDPPRLAIDLEGIELDPTLKDLVAQVKPDDPYIQGVRVGQNAPSVVRLVLDLKQPVLPQVFALEPVAAYKNRLVLDLYPEQPVDPLERLIAQRWQDIQGKSAGTPESDALGEWIAQKNTNTAPTSTPTPTSAASVPPVSDAAPSRAPSGKETHKKPEKKHTPQSANLNVDRLIIVALDPGHGGEDPGAIGPNGTREKDVVLSIARLLRDRINATTLHGSPMRAFMTREADYFVPLQVRVEKARRVQADLFLSLHADAFMTPTARGASVFALSPKGASSTAARWIAEKENKADWVGGVNVRVHDKNVQRALLDMSTTAQINDSLKLGTALLNHIGRVGRLHKPQVEQAGFAVLKAPDIPSVLVETAFISNPEEESKLRTPEYQKELVQAIMRGIEKYFESNPPLARHRGV